MANGDLFDRVVAGNQGAPVEGVVLGSQRVEFDADALVGFVDEQPGANWGHAAHFALCDVTTGEVRRIGAQFPPAIPLPPLWRLAWRPDGVEPWQLLATSNSTTKEVG